MHILYKHCRHTWPSAASPEAKRVKGYLCSSRDPSTLWTRFQAASNETGSASQCFLSEQILGLCTANRKPEGEKNNKKKNRKQLVSFSWQWELLLCWSTTWANIKETSKPEHQQKTSRPSCLQRSGNMMIFFKYAFPSVSIKHFLPNTVTQSCIVRQIHYISCTKRMPCIHNNSMSNICT